MLVQKHNHWQLRQYDYPRGQQSYDKQLIRNINRAETQYKDLKTAIMNILKNVEEDLNNCIAEDCKNPLLK